MAVFSKFRQFLYLSAYFSFYYIYFIVHKTVSFTNLETEICFVKKTLFNIFLGLCVYFFQKSVKMILDNHSLKRFWTRF